MKNTTIDTSSRSSTAVPGTGTVATCVVVEATPHRYSMAHPLTGGGGGGGGGTPNPAAMANGSNDLHR